MKNILVLIDLNKAPENILRSASKIANQLHANLVLSCFQYDVSLIEELHDSEGLLHDEKYFSCSEHLADFLRAEPSFYGDFGRQITCIDPVDDDLQTIKKFVVNNNILMTIQSMPESMESNDDNVGISIPDMVKFINCPHLFIPDHMDLTLIDKIAYFTDLRYCDTGVVNFLKIFNAFIFITHLSASGIPDLDESYAQSILSEEIAVRTGYKKLFLRNIKRVNLVNDLEKVIESTQVGLCAIVNKKHRLLEELFPPKPVEIRNFRRLPLLIFPYFDWFFSS
ncbi:MAG TPA: hypothetical protein VIM16_21220 [Mucilaginibacter sp.]|jgi:hypothetical protein